MTLHELTLALWLALTAFPLWGTLLIALHRMRAKPVQPASNATSPDLPIEVFVPVKGSFPDQEPVLNSLLEQTYPCYSVAFIVEDEADPANRAVDALCQRHAHARKIISGISSACAQKNHNLVYATKVLSPETRILLFCDSTNSADPGWIRRLSLPLRNGTSEVVTTFRAFDPKPETVGGVCQAMYAAFLVLLQVNKPTPWGGATAILRDTFERLAVREAWSSTVVDDLVLSSVLERAGVRPVVDPSALLTSPLSGQTVDGFLRYLDRQVLFPKYTHPGIWIMSLFFVVNVCLAVCVALAAAVQVPLGLAGSAAAWASCSFLSSMVLFVGVLHRTTAPSISSVSWFTAFLPCLFLSAYVFLRSVFRRHIDWHGRRYIPGRKGIVKETHLLQANPG